MTTLKKTVQALIANGETEAAIDSLSNAVVNANEKLQDDLVLIRSRYADYLQLQRNDTMDEEGIQILNNKLKKDILSLATELDKKPIITLVTNSVKPVMQVSFLVGGLIICLLLVMLGAVLTNLNSCLSSKKKQDVPTVAAATNSQDLNKIVDSLYYDEIEPLYNEYQSIYLGGALNKTKKVLETADKLDSQLKQIDPAKLDDYNVIHRAMGLTIIYKIRSLLAEKNEKRLDYSQKAMRFGTEVKTALSNVENMPGAEKEKVIKWIADNNHWLRADINLFVAKSVNHLAGGAVGLPDIRADYERLKNDLVIEGYVKYPVLQQLNQKYPKIFTVFKQPNL